MYYYMTLKKKKNVNVWNMIRWVLEYIEFKLLSVLFYYDICILFGLYYNNVYLMWVSSEGHGVYLVDIIFLYTIFQMSIN